jgi:hypothetical protein
VSTSALKLNQLASGDEPFLSRVITGDESWVYGYNPEAKQQSSQWKSPTSPRPKKARQVKSKGIMHKEFVPTGQTVNSRFYCNVSQQLHENV